MKKLLMSAAVVFIAFSCQNEQSEIPEAIADASTSRHCSSHDVLERKLRQDPSLAARMEKIETFTEKAIAEGRLVNGKIVIPVVFNVVYRTAEENISLARLQSQIDVLNKDFNAQNSDFNNPTPYASVKANVGISFVLDKVVRKETTRRSWTDDDAVKKSSRGGISPTNPTTSLNFWVCNLADDLLGYAQFPGDAAATDGVVCTYDAVGINKANSRFGLGRTATHEIGHWMNLIHIWGDRTCGSDRVSDTPVHNDANLGVPPAGHRSTCSGTPLEMFMNYMDYTDDKAMFMFSNGQKSRMLAIFASGGSRASFR
jgi:Pregnancy-associated plasma protein-A